MKRLALVVVLLAMTTDVFPEEGKPKLAPVGVEAFIERDGMTSGRVRVRGIVAKTLPDKQLLSLVDVSDREELVRTGKTQCVTLPVRWPKEMPPLHSLVVVEGDIREMDGKKVFVADTLEAEGQ